MIIRKLSVMKRCDRVIAAILSCLVAIVTIGTFVLRFVFIGMGDKGVLFFRVLLGILCTASMFDIIALIKQNSSIGLKIVRFFVLKRKKRKSMLVTPDSNEFQQKVCEGICGRQDINSFVYIYGFPNRGKTTAAFFLLEGIFFNNMKYVAQLKDIVFIDCTSNKDDIFAFFEANGNIPRLSRFENSLVVLDNVEELGSRFIEINNELFNSESNLFVLIEDSDSGETFVDKELLQVAKQFEFNKSLIDTHFKDDIYPQIEHLSPKDKEIFFAIYFTILTDTFAQNYIICKVLRVKKKDIIGCLKHIRKANIFLPFPFNRDYIYCVRKQSLEEIDKFYTDDEAYNKVLKEFVESEHVNYESKWICFVKSKPQAIEQKDEIKRTKLFSDALVGGRYKTLYKTLKHSISLQPEKELLFIYEYGVLNFHMGNHKEAFCLFNKMMENLQEPKRKEAMLHIIESSHGSSALETMSTIRQYIEEMKKEVDLYSLYALYWETHIQTEKGVFNFSTLQSIREGLQQKAHLVENTYLYNETIKRCYTDEIRCHHILGIDLPKSLVDGFTEFLRQQGKSLYDYYYNLYIKANSIHYLDIAKCIQEESDTKALDLTAKATVYYERANQSQFSDEKSRWALRVKQLELEMIPVCFDVDAILHQIDEFLMHAQANDVDVHEAFCQTLLAKVKIADQGNMSNREGVRPTQNRIREVQKHLDNAKKIYSKYQNRYGIFRVHFLQLLFKLYHSPNGQQQLLDQLEELISNHQDYMKEKEIVDRIHQRSKSNKGMKLMLYWTLRSYPIIMQ